MLLLLSFLLSRKAVSFALPVLSPSFPQEPTHDPISYITTTATTGASSGRSIWDIVWSCLATTFACTWVTVHPNIPFLRENKKSTTIWRLYLMLLTLTAPEIMLLWAFKQLQGALMIMMTVNKAISAGKGDAAEKSAEDVAVSKTGELDIERKGKTTDLKTDHPQAQAQAQMWTLTHAHYLQMGGFRLQCALEVYEEVDRARVGRKITAEYGPKIREFWEVPLTFETMKRLINSGALELPSVHKSEILDKCGKDAFSKTVAVLQLTWFILQIIARACQNLAVTELEITTAALASLNIAMYISWWSKPNDILCPTIVQTRDLQEKIRSWKSEHHVPSPSVHTTDSTLDIQQCPTLPLNSDHSSPTTTRDGELRFVTEENEKVNIMIHYGSEMKKMLKSSLKLFTSPTTTFAAVSGAFGKLLTARFRFQQASDTSAKPWYLRALSAVAAVPVSIWSTIAHLFIALIYYPVLAILGSGRRLTLKSAGITEGSGTKVEVMTTIELINSNTAQLFLMDLGFFCENSRSAPFFCLSAMSGAIFGMIHCLAWNFQFPSRVEQILWRASSSIVVGICICMVAAAVTYSLSGTPDPKTRTLKGTVNLVISVNRIKKVSPPRNESVNTPKPRKAEPKGVNALQRFVNKMMVTPPSADKPKDNVKRNITIWDFVCSTFAICFVLARLSLLTLSIVELRALPISAFDIVRWSGFIPHI